MFLFSHIETPPYDDHPVETTSLRLLLWPLVLARRKHLAVKNSCNYDHNFVAQTWSCLRGSTVVLEA